MKLKIKILFIFCLVQVGYNGNCDASTTLAPTTTTLAHTTTALAPTKTTLAPTTTTLAPTTTTLTPYRTTLAPTTTTLAPSKTTLAPTTTTLVHSKTTLAPTSTTLAPTTTTLAPSRTTLVPTTTTLAPSRTTLAPTTTTLAPSRTTLAPTTTTLAPSKTTLAPTTTTLAPSKTTLAPTTTTLAPSRTTLAPTTTTLAPSKTTLAPTTTTLVHSKTTLAPTSTTLAPTTTTLAPSRTTLAPTTTTLAPSRTTLAPATTTLAHTTTNLAPTTTTLAPSKTTLAPTTTTLAPSKTTLAPTTTTLALTPFIVSPTSILTHTTTVSLSPTTLSPSTSTLAATAPPINQGPQYTIAKYRPIHQGSQYTIGCLANGDVIVKGMDATSSVQIIPQKEGCNETLNVDGSTLTIPAICLNSMNYMEKRTVTFNIKDPIIDGETTYATALPIQLNGGQSSHKYSIECQPLTENGMEVYIVHGVGLLLGKTIKVPTELDRVEMRLKAEEFGSKEDITDLPDVSSVYLGDKFYMYLLYLGENEYRVIPESCKAYDGAYAAEPSSSVNSIDLWKKDTCVQTDAANYHLMHNFKVLEKTVSVVYAEMFGFRFAKTTDITFVCSVRICPTSTKSVQCTLKEGANCTDNSRWSARRRRRTVTNMEYKVVRRIKVTDRKPDNAAEMYAWSWLLVFIMQMVIKLV